MPGSRNLIFRKANGTLWMCGDNSVGAIGDNTRNYRSSPVSVVGNHIFTTFTSCRDTTYALKADGTAWAWGYNATAGALGDNTITSRSSPVSVVGNHSFIQISGDGSPATVLALKSDGTAWSWGAGTYGNIGDNNVISRSSPVSVVGNHSFVKIAGGFCSSHGIKADGTCWGWGSYFTLTQGQIGDNTNQPRSSPVSVVGNHSFKDIACSGTDNFTLGLKADGRVWAWGYNVTAGQLGDNTLTNKSSPILVVGNHSFIKVVPGESNTIALKEDGTVWGWGYNGYGNLSDNTRINRSSPVSVVGNHKFVDVWTNYLGGVGIKANGEIWSWGSSSNGELGQNIISLGKSSPVICVGVVDEIPHFINIGGSYGIKSGNITAWAWGDNDYFTNYGYGVVGDNTITNRSSPVSVVGNHQFESIMKHGNQCAALKADGTAWCWGYGNGCIGDGTVSYRSSPVSVVGNHSFIQIVVGDYDIANTFGLKANGECWGCGGNTIGNLGDNTINSRSSPVSVVGNHLFTMIGTHCGIKADGTVWSWGYNAISGQCGDNTIIDRSSPVSVVGNHSFVWIVGSNYNRFALKADGTAWAWGHNLIGNIGDNTITYRSSPVSVVGNHIFTKIRGVSRYPNGNPSGTIALKANGSAWCWGNRSVGQCGDNTVGVVTVSDRSSPVSVVGNHSFIDVWVNNYNGYGLKSNGEIWAWGGNSTGDVGDGTRIDRSSPVQVVGLFCS